MFRELCFARRALWIVWALAFLPVVIDATGQEPTRPAISQGEVIGNDVYVRSGPSLNHYPVYKLNAGDRLTIVGDTGDWYEIVPPEGVFSFISGDYVDTAGGTTGVVNGNNVRVRAGSTLPDFSKLKYTIQMQLPKGAEVTILGREPDGFLRIKPPTGTTVWVNRGYVEPVPDALAAAEQTDRETVSSSAVTPEAGPADTGTPDDDEVETDAPKAAEAVPAVSQQPKKRQELEDIDAAVRAVLTKPVPERDFQPLIERYKAIAERAKDDPARQFARIRVDQLSDMAALVNAVRTLRKLEEETGWKRRGFLEDRARIREELPSIPRGLDAQGELRVSALYPPEKLPCRYRLVDAGGGRERTIGYLEIPTGSTIDVDGFLGRYVGVRAVAKRLQTGGVNPVPIYVAGDLILLEPPAAPSDLSPQD